MNDRDVLAELRQEVGLLHGGIATAHHGDLLVLEEEAIARRTGGYATAQHLLLAGNVQVARGGAGSQDHRTGLILLAIGPHLLDLAGQVDLLHVLLTQVSAETLGLGAHLFHQIRAHDALLESGKVLHLGGLHQQSAVLHALENHRVQLGACRVYSSGVTRRAGTDDDDVVNLACLRVRSAVCTGRAGVIRVRGLRIIAENTAGLQEWLVHIYPLRSKMLFTPV